MSTSSSTTSSTPSSTTGSSTSLDVPRVGGVRCYWALLQPRYLPPKVHPINLAGSNSPKLELTFVHLDPVLSVHMARQKMSMMNRGVIEFIHPHEREQARKDLAEAVESNDLQGSVTRVRFARLSRIRTILGGSPEEIDIPSEATAYVEDEDWMILDLVLNWVADGLLLAFFHAIKDIDPVANNDPHRQHEGWSNYCGTANLPEEQIRAIHENITALVAPPVPGRYPPIRVFQIHSTSSSPTRPGSLLFSWPPPRVNPLALFDGLYNAEEYSNLMRGVNMDSSQHKAAPEEIRTSCTTRFGAKHSITSEGVYRHVTSVFIPYGSLMFACFQTTKSFELSPRSQVLFGVPITPTIQQEWDCSPGHDNGIGSASHTPHDWQRSGVEMSKRSRDDYEFDDGYGQHAIPPRQPESMYPSPTAVSPGYPQSNPGSHHDRHSSNSQQFSPQPSPDEPQSQSERLAMIPEFIPYSLHSLPPTHPYSAFSHLIPPVPPLPSNTMTANSYQPSILPPLDSEPGLTRPLVRPPGDTECCRLCGIRESPEWRRSENGIKDLCNACGLRLARAQAKKEGRQKPRKKKDKASE